MWKNTVKVTAPSQFPTVLFWLHNQPNWSPWVAGLICHLELLTVSLPRLVGVPLALRPRLAQRPANPAPFLSGLRLCLMSLCRVQFETTSPSPLGWFLPRNRGWWVRTGKTDCRVRSHMVQTVLQKSNRVVRFSWSRAKCREGLASALGWYGTQSSGKWGER